MAMKGKLSNSKLASELEGVIDSNVVVANYVQCVLQQGDIKHIAEIEKLPDHQKLSRKHAQFWRDSVKPKIHETVKDTIHFSKVFLKRWDRLQLLIDEMKKGEEKAKNEIMTTLNVLVSNLDVVISHAKAVVANVAKLKSMLSEDMKDFQQDFNEAQKKLIGDNADKRALQNELAAINKAIGRDLGLIAVGSWLAAGEAIDLKKQESKKNDVEKELAKDKQKIRVLNAVKRQIDGLLKAIPTVVNAAKSLEGEWSALKSDVEEVISELKNLSTTKATDYLSPLLETAKKDWAVVLEKAEQL